MKESTEVRIIQNKGKEKENSYQKLKRSPEERYTRILYHICNFFTYYSLPWNTELVAEN